jgi:U3 small nucleolar RNA-associated protein 20
MRDVAQKLCLQLKSDHLDASLSLQVVKNLLYIGKCFYTVPVSSMNDEGTNDMDGDDLDVGGNNGDAQESNPLPWLFSKLSYQVRSAHIGRRNRSSSIVSG